MSKLYFLRITEMREKTVPVRAQTAAMARAKGLSRLARGVVADRYFFSSVAYQSLNVSYEWVKGINRFATLPDVLVFIDVSVDKAVERLTKFRTSTEIYEKRELLQQIDRNYREVIKEFEDNLKVIYLNGNLDIDKIYGDVEEKFAPLFADKK